MGKVFSSPTACELVFQLFAEITACATENTEPSAMVLDKTDLPDKSVVLSSSKMIAFESDG